MQSVASLDAGAWTEPRETPAAGDLQARGSTSHRRSLRPVGAEVSVAAARTSARRPERASPAPVSGRPQFAGAFRPPRRSFLAGRALGAQMGRTLAAFGPLGPCSSSYSTFAPS